jgi:hypothetical protein
MPCHDVQDALYRERLPLDTGAPPPGTSLPRKQNERVVCIAVVHPSMTSGAIDAVKGERCDNVSECLLTPLNIVWAMK